MVRNEQPALTSLLTPEEEQYVYNVEVLGLPPKKAADLAGMPFFRAKQMHILEARKLIQYQMRGHIIPTREDAVAGIRDAIDRARIIAEPMTEIVGWKALNSMLGYDAPKEVNINMNASVEVLAKQVRTLSTQELIDKLGAGNIIDGEFYARE